MMMNASTVEKLAQLLPLLRSIQSQVREFVGQLNAQVRDGAEWDDALPQIISRAEAHKRNQPIYYTGTPCIRGHLSDRFTRNYARVECNRIANRKRAREMSQWLKEHRTERGARK